MSLRRVDPTRSNVTGVCATDSTVTGTAVTAGALACAHPAFGRISGVARSRGTIAGADVTTRRKWSLNAHLAIDAHLRVNRIE